MVGFRKHCSGLVRFHKRSNQVLFGTNWMASQCELILLQKVFLLESELLSSFFSTIVNPQLKNISGRLNFWPVELVDFLTFKWLIVLNCLIAVKIIVNVWRGMCCWAQWSSEVPTRQNKSGLFQLGENELAFKLKYFWTSNAIPQCRRSKPKAHKHQVNPSFLFSQMQRKKISIGSSKWFSDRFHVL